MGKSAKAYKRATKKEKLGLATSQKTSLGARGIQRHAPISAQLASHGGSSSAALREPATLGRKGGLRDLEDHSAISQAAKKLLLEAEKRAASTAANDEQEMIDDEDGMEMDGQQQGSGGTGKKKAGASGLKQKAGRKRQQQQQDPEVESKSKPDYVDLFEGRRTKKVLR